MGRIRVLLVDDHPTVREGLRAMLGTEPDIQVVAEAGDGLEAVQKVAEHKPDVILMDVRMPNMDGLEATRRIKAEFPSISIIMLTVYDDDSYIINAVRAGAGGYLCKDTSKDLLMHTIRAVSTGGIVLRSRLLREAVAGLLGPEAAQVREGRHQGFEELSPRDVLMLVAEGRTNKEIGEALLISEDTAKTHVQSIIDKLGVADRTQAAVKAVGAGHQPEVGDTFAEFEKLSPREKEVLVLLVKGRTNKEIAEVLLISEDTAKKHVHNIIGKLGAADRTQAAVKAVRAGYQPEVGDTFAEDVKYYKENLSKFLAAYKGKYIALLNKQILDSDTDFSQLAKRVYAKFGYRDIFMPKVTEKEEVVHIPTPFLERSSDGSI